MTLYEKIRNSRDAHEMAKILNILLEDEDYELCGGESRGPCEYDGHSCNECIYIKLRKEV